MSQIKTKNCYPYSWYSNKKKVWYTSTCLDAFNISVTKSGKHM